MTNVPLFQVSTGGDPTSEDLVAGDLVVVATSPKAGTGLGRDRIDSLRQALQSMGLEVSIETEIAAICLAVKVAVEGNRRLCVVAAGGDGTLNLLASMLPSGVPIMPFPLGTENLAAIHYGLLGADGSFDLNLAIETVVRGRNHWIDAGIATFPNRRKSRREKMFLIMASVGFDADVVRRMHLTRRGHIRRWSYLKPFLSSLRSYRYPKILVERRGVERADEPAELLKVAWALVFNIPKYAVGLVIESQADETDGKLDFCGLSYGSHLYGLRYFLGVLFRKHTSWSDVKRARGEAFRLSSERPLAVQLDGDYAGRLPVEIRIEPRRVTLRLPIIKGE